MKRYRASFSLEREYVQLLEKLAKEEHRSKTAQLRHYIMEHAEKAGIDTKEVLKASALTPA